MDAEMVALADWARHGVDVPRCAERGRAGQGEATGDGDGPRGDQAVRDQVAEAGRGADGDGRAPGSG